MKISLLQLDIKDGQSHVNQANVQNLLQEALLEEPDVIVLPELWNSGYALDKLEKIADEDGKVSRPWLSQFAEKHGVTLVAGSVATKRKGQFYNTAYSFSSKGQLINTYDKVHLFGLMAEDKFLTAGQRESCFQIGTVGASHVICYDIRFPEWIRHLMSQDAALLFVSAQWPSSRIEQWRLLLQARAIENQAFVIAVNRVGQGLKDQFNGHSLIIDPLGKILLEANDCEGVFSAQIDLNQVKKVRGQIPVFKDRRLELY
ncbi:carbon-nitrogen family hydrolase [Streptococcus mutans]|uniref:carbon-nitrogen family hydrolase n=1 Tax=Streptococcus mutans TaxID=1309 RepID=UPI0038BB5761